MGRQIIERCSANTSRGGGRSDRRGREGQDTTLSKPMVSVVQHRSATTTSMPSPIAPKLSTGRNDIAIFLFRRTTFCTSKPAMDLAARTNTAGPSRTAIDTTKNSTNVSQKKDDGISAMGRIELGSGKAMAVGAEILYETCSPSLRSKTMYCRKQNIIGTTNK